VRVVLLLLLLVCSLLYLAGPSLVDLADRAANQVTSAPAVPHDSVTAYHNSLWLADFHNDALLWRRDLNERSAHGQLDIPRLRTGGYELAVFSAPTRYPPASNYARTPAVGDAMVLAAVLSRWPRDTWFDPYARALLLAREMQETAARSSGRLRTVLTRPQLEALLRDQASGDGVIGAVLLVEGLHLLGGNVARVDSLFAAGYRVFGIAHMFDNEVGGSAHGWRKGGLTPFGRRVVARIDSLGGIIDLAHASSATIDDVLAIITRPVVVSHGGLSSVCPGPRNLPDAVARRIADAGGIIAVGFWDAAVCGDDAAAIARSIHRAVVVAGAGHVALGSDFDGAVATPFDAAHMAMLTSALFSEGLSREEIRAVMGENEKRFLLEMLPRR
jgi:microsomal dipeptidase-like Zn-dependent dipeptidase